MTFDFSAVLVLLTAISGAIWGTWAWWLAPQRPPAEGEEREEPLLVEYARSFFPIFLIVLVLRSFIAEPFRIPSGSMMPTLLVGDFILVNKFEYGIRLPVINKKIIEIGAPKRGDIVVFRYPENPSIPYIKRIVAIPGDHIVYKDKKLWINGKLQPQKYLGRYLGIGSGEMMTGAEERLERVDGKEHRILIIPGRPTVNVDTVVPPGHYFAMGDNRDNSRDSRYWGFVPDENLIGHAFMIWMNWDSRAGGIDFGRIGTFLQ